MQQLSDKEIANLARRQKIDIAIHRNGHSQNSRSNIFAYRAAPIQISYLGFPGTTGSDCMDYLIADKIVIPQESKIHYSENIIYLPNSYQVNDSNPTLSKRNSSYNC